MSLPDQWLEVNLKDGTGWKAEIGCLEQVEEAYRQFNEQMPKEGSSVVPDKVLEIPLICGTTLMTAVGGIAYLVPTSRRIAELVGEHNREIDKLRNPLGE